MATEVQQLANCFAQTLAPQKELIQQAEEQIKKASQQSGYSINVLKVVAEASVDPAVRLAASVSFKNLTKYRWVPSEADAYSGVQALDENEKTQIKGLLPGLMLSTPPLVQAQLSEALSIVCSHDFPGKWPNLLGELVERLNTTLDMPTINGVMATANSIFKRYRNQYGSDAMVKELEESQNVFAPPLLETLRKMSAALPGVQHSGDMAALKQMLSSVRYMCRIFFSLNAPGLTPLMESQLDAWMGEFHTYLAFPSAPGLEESDPEKESVLDGLKSAVCQNINLFMETNEEEFAKFLPTFVTVVWELLLQLSLKPGQDNLAMSAIRFLTTVSKSVHHSLFQNQGALQQICEKIVVPNSRVRTEDEEVFEMNPVEYIRRDAEGSDSDTRRRAAADLVKSLTEKFPQEVTTLFTGYIQSMLSEYAANPLQNWKSKDCAVYLVLALTVRGKTGAQGATTTNQLVNITDFFSTQVLPELQSPKINENPILKADAIKFITTFRSMLPKEACIGFFPALITLLGSEYYVVHSYSAIAIERLLSLREAGQLRFTPADLNQFLSALLEKLFAGFKLPESSENEYLMKCVMRVIGFVGPAIAPVAPTCLQALAQMLVEVCKNPRNPGFNHYLFESVAALIRHATAGQISMVETFEQMLFPAFNLVLQQDVQEFHPYVFQIFAQLIELRAAPLPAVYMQIFPPLLSPVFWERAGNVPALVRLIQAYITKAHEDIVKNGHLLAILGVFQKLVASKSHDHEGFNMLNTMVDSLPLSAYEQYMGTVWTLLFSRLQGSRTHKFVRSFIVFMAFFICKYGPAATSASADQVQPGILLMLVQQVWVPNMASVGDSTDELKAVLVATTKLLCEFPPLQQNQQLWAALKDAAAKSLEGGAALGDGGCGDEEEELGAGAGGYSAAYAKLANASKVERPVLAEIADPKQYMESSLAQLYQAYPGAAR